MAAQQFLSLSMRNRFSFKCPIFDEEVEMRSCVMLRDKVYSGERIETRRGCQACIQSSKCPAAELVRRIAFGSTDATDHCGSPEKKVGRLPGDVLDRIAAVLVQEAHLRERDVPLAERELIASSRARIEAQAETAPRTKVEGRNIRTSQVQPEPQHIAKNTAATKTPSAAAINTAAATGDMAAALNAA